MFKPVAFDPYGRRRSRWRVPKWLVLIVLGIAIGVAGLYYFEERIAGPRLSLPASNELRRSFAEADADRVKLKTALSEAARQRDAAVSERASMASELAASKSGVQSLQDDLNSVVTSLPPDPRGGPVQIRTGWVVLRAGKLAYDIVVTRDAKDRSAAPIAATAQFSIAGETMAAVPRTVNLTPVAVTIGAQQILRGSLPLPGDFKPFQSTIQIVERDSGKALGMRVFLVK